MCLKDVLLFPAKYTGNCDLSMPSVSKVRKARSQSSYKKRQEWSSSMLPSSYRNASVNAKETYMSLKEYKPGTTFPGVIGLTVDQSSPAWPEPMRAREGAPNVLFIVLDDTGYGQLGCFGSPIETPNLDALAEGGLRYTNMHTTALCSPTRACVITGRNHHSNALAAITELATGYPGYNGNMPFENGFLSEMLLQQGYNTYMIGKYHLVPSNLESAAGPYERWPLGRGFERYYGFLGGDTHQYYPDLIYDNHQVEPPRTPEEGYTLNEDLADKAIQFIADAKQVAPNKPFYLHFCPGATHAPHHVPKKWADRYDGMFDDGWDAYREKVFTRQKELGIVPADAELSRHDPDVPEWDPLSPEQKKLYARMMEVFAGFLTHTDYHIGRLLDYLKSTGEFDNTLIMVISDNGASAEGGPGGTTNEGQFFNNAQETLQESLAKLDQLGGPQTFNHYAWGWTFAGNTPFRRWKRETYRDGWRAVCPWPGPSFKEAGKPFGAPISAETLAELDAHGWELYHVAEDVAENLNVAEENHERVINMIATWYVEAGKYKVLPIDGSAVQRLIQERPQLTVDRLSYTYFPDTQTVPWYASVHVLNRPHSITADVEIPRGGAEGVLLCQGTGVGGYAFYVKDGKLKYAHNYVSRAIYQVESVEPVPEGRHQLRFEFEPTGKPDIPHGKGAPGRGLLYIDSKLVGATELPVTTPVIFNPGGLTCGANPGLPVTPEYPSPFKFTGKIYGVTVDVSGDLIRDTEAELSAVMARQ